MTWRPNDPETARKLKAIDRKRARARAAAQNLPLAQKIEAYRAADRARDDATAKLQAALLFPEQARS